MSDAQAESVPGIRSSSGLVRLAWLGLACISLTVFLGKSYETSLPPNDSALHAAVALDTTSRGLVPRLAPAPGKIEATPRRVGLNDHPFTFFYLNGWIMRWLGASAWSARLLPALLGVGSVLATAWLGTWFGSEVAGVASGLILCLSMSYIRSGASFHLDLPMIVCMLLSFIAWVRGRPVQAGVAAAIGACIKTPVSFLIIPAAILADITQRRFRWGEWIRLSASAFVLYGAFWAVLNYFDPFVVRDYWVRQVWGSAVHGRGVSERDLLVFFKFAFLGRDFAPWGWLFLVALVFELLRGLLKRDSGHWRRLALPLSGLFVFVLLVSLVRFKYGYYFLPTLPLIAILTTSLLEPALRKVERPFLLGTIGLGMILPTFLVSSPIALSPEMFPALRRFRAVIQSYGDCEDQVLFVPGGQPYGGEQEYRLETLFYTGRGVTEASCERVNELARDPHAGWIIVTEESLKQCVNAETRAEFPTVLRFGQQSLLSRRMPNGVPLDLELLERELSVATDCHPGPLPRDRYH